MLYLPYGALAAAFVLIYLPRYIVSREMKKLPGGYDNSEPRRQQANLEGLGRRALGAHLNGFEAFTPFAAAVLAALQRGARLEAVGAIAVAFVAFRTVYMFAYLEDRAGLRSTAWVLGMLGTTSLFVLAIVG